MILTFGAYKGKNLSEVPDGYVKWLALRGSYPEPGNRFEVKWKVPIEVKILARREMEKRGWKRVDNRYEREG